MAQWLDDSGNVRMSGTLIGDAEPYSAGGSHQPVGPDLELAAGAGAGPGDTAFISPVMGNLLGAGLVKVGNYLGGLIGHFSVTGSVASTYPTGAVLAGVGDGVTDCDGAVVAYIDGDSDTTHCGAMFKVRSNNSTAASGPDFGLDLQDAAHDGYQPVDAAFYKSAPARLVADVVFLVGSAAPADGVTGAGVAGPGSLYLRAADAAGEAYVNTGTKAAPTWVALS